jgi:formylglycine-generating enzyme required for sulfatase activity
MRQQVEGYRGLNDGVPDILWLSAAPGGESDEAEEQPRPRKRGVFTVQPFYIAKFLVTDAQYQAFVRAEDGFKHPDWWAGMPANYQPQELADQRTKAPNNPRDTLSWYQSVAFARWLDAKYRSLGLFANFPVATPNGVSKTIALNPNDWQIRLPLEWEWQWAAQNGDEARKYPWGDWKPGFANTNEAGLGHPSAVGMYPHGAADCGALDMAGNLFEWCLNDSSNPRNVRLSNDEEKVLRGGSFDSPRRYAACACRHSHSPGPRHHRAGFRLVVSAPIASLVSESECNERL